MQKNRQPFGTVCPELTTDGECMTRADRPRKGPVTTLPVHPEKKKKSDCTLEHQKQYEEIPLGRIPQHNRAEQEKKERKKKQG